MMMSDSDNDNNDELVFNLEEFSLFLAANLVGGYSLLQKRLDTSITSLPKNQTVTANNSDDISTMTSVSIPIYWRSPLLHNIPAHDFIPQDTDTTVSKTKRSKQEDTTSDKMLQVMFLDATVVFQTQLNHNTDDEDNTKVKETSSDRQSTTIAMAFGALVRDPTNDYNNCYYYLQGSPVTTNYLSDHFEQHDILVKETEALPIANQMGRALLSLRGANHTENEGIMAKAVLDSRGRLQQVDIPLLYSDGTSYLSIIAANPHQHDTVQPLNAHVASTMLCSIVSQEQQSLAQAAPNEEQNTGGKDNGGYATKESGSNSPSSMSNGPIHNSHKLNTNNNKVGPKDILAKYHEWQKKAGKWLVKCQRVAVANTTSSSSTCSTTMATTNSNNGTGKARDWTPTKNPKPSPSKPKPSPGKLDNHNKGKKKRPEVRYGAVRIGGKKKKKQKTSSFAFVDEDGDE